MSHPHLFVLAALKGAIEHQDPSHYFGATGALAFHLQNAAELGLMDGAAPTERGRAIYRALGLASMGDGRTRACMWDWSNVPPLPGTTKVARALHKKKA